ncbi:MAG: thiosulfate oxidation carrier protein SoxY [Oceanospirillaceae bacterium]|nr:thiosulfate oxidation carrier protein SoxY [Oceanospirillaceae bacterium]
MMQTRRQFIKKTLTIGGALWASSWLVVKPLWAQTETLWPTGLFAHSKYQAALKDITGGQALIASKDITLTIPRIAENGALIPFSLSSTLEKAERVFVLVKKNPVPLVARFTLSPQVNTQLSARLKMAKTSQVVSIVLANGQYYYTDKTVKVTLGGCGG